MGYGVKKKMDALSKRYSLCGHYNKERTTIYGTCFLIERAQGKHVSSEELSANL